MNLLMVGTGKGSWTIRGEQLGAALGARVTSQPTEADWRWASLVVLVKRAGVTFAAQAQRAGVPIVWDALDFWGQPFDNGKREADARQLLAAQIAAIRPALTIGATKAMAEAAGGAYLPHHSWSGLVPQPARDGVQAVVYEGNPAYLGRWRQAVTDACHRRGWTFVVNPSSLQIADLVVTFRDGQWDGWMCREWKSGVKVVNAIAAGRPIIGQPSAAMAETRAPGSRIDACDQIDAAFDEWTPVAARAAAVDVCRMLAPALTLEAVAARYRQVLADVEARCAA